MEQFDTVTITGQSDRWLIEAGQPSERYLLVQLVTPERATQTDRLPLNLSLIIDRSGSMSGQKLDYVRQAVVHVLRVLTPTDRTAIIIYDDEVELLSPSLTVNSDHRQQMIDQVEAIRPGGMTNLSGGWFLGIEQASQHQSRDYLNRAFLLTDGLANVGLTDHEELVFKAKEFRKQGITTTTFGVGHDFNQFLLQGIAEGGGGHFYFIDSPTQIPNYFEGELGEMLTTVAREMTLEVTPPAGGEVELLNQIPTEMADQRLRVFLGDSYAADQRKLVFKIKLPACDLRQQRSLSLQLQYEDAQHRQAVTVETDPLTFTAVSSNAYHQQAVNESVLQEAARMETEKAKLIALKLADKRDLAGVQQVLQQARQTVSRVTSQAISGPFVAELTNLEAKIKQGLSVQETRSMHYETTMAHYSRRDYKK